MAQQLQGMVANFIARRRLQGPDCRAGRGQPGRSPGAGVTSRGIHPERIRRCPLGSGFNFPSYGDHWMDPPRGTPGSRQFSMMTVYIVIWNVMAGIEAAAVDLPVKVLCSTIGYLGICGVTPLFLGFSMAYAGKDAGTGLVGRVLIWGMPAVTLLLVFTNGAHHLVWTSFDWISTTRGRVLVYNHGPWYWAWVAYNAAASLAAVVYLMQAAFQCRRLYFGQMLVLLAGAALPGSVSCCTSHGRTRSPAWTCRPSGLPAWDCSFSLAFRDSRCSTSCPLHARRSWSGWRTGSSSWIPTTASWTSTPLPRSSCP